MRLKRVKKQKKNSASSDVVIAPVVDAIVADSDELAWATGTPGIYRATGHELSRPVGYPVANEWSAPVSRVQQALKSRQISATYRLASEHRKLLWKVRHTMSKLRRNLKLKQKLDAEYLKKVPVLLNEAAARGVLNIKVNTRCGWVTVDGVIGDKAVRGHIWTDLRGPVLDFTEASHVVPPQHLHPRFRKDTPILRIKAFSKVFVEDRTLDVLFGDRTPNAIW